MFHRDSNTTQFYLVQFHVFLLYVDHEFTTFKLKVNCYNSGGHVFKQSSCLQCIKFFNN